MIAASPSGHEVLLNGLVERYLREGFAVLKEPDPQAVPFDLGGYRPDLLAWKGGQHLIIEVKTQAERISFDSLRSVADEVRRHEGWQFLLVTGQDVEETPMPGETEDKFSWEEAARALKEASAAGTPHARTLAFIHLWVVFERAMRYQSRCIALPVERLASPRTMIEQLYSLGELSAAQFEIALQLVRIRNQVFHGLFGAGVDDDLNRLAGLVQELRQDWGRGGEIGEHDRLPLVE